MTEFIVAAIVCLTQPTGTEIMDYIAVKASDEDGIADLVYAAQVIPFLSGGKCYVTAETTQVVEPFAAGSESETQ